MKISSATDLTALNAAVESLGGSSGTQGPGWSEIVGRISHLTKHGLKNSAPSHSQINQLSGLLKLQVDVTRYQLRVELVSKVSESAVASMRKLQQSQ